jgi:mannose-1-phosphate guanylyltransferase
MLEHTMARAGRIAPASNQVTVVSRTHLPEVRQMLRDPASGSIVLQPRNRDTAAGVFLPLTYVRAQDPNAIVVIYPSDQFIYPETKFVDAVETAVEAARQTKRLVLLGVAPEGPEVEYGWICPAENLAVVRGRTVRRVRRFIEKPAQNEAEAALAAGGLWNTLVLAARLDVLWKLGMRFFPEMIRLFDMLADSIGTADEGYVLDAIYRVMPAHNFSSHLLARAIDDVAVVELRGVLWSDWGKPERIADTLRRVGRTPAFPLELLEEPARAETGAEQRIRAAAMGALPEDITRRSSMSTQKPRRPEQAGVAGDNQKKPARRTQRVDPTSEQIRQETAGRQLQGGSGPSWFSSEEDLYARIAETAYQLYERRGRQTGHELEDWLEAERQILGSRGKPTDPSASR